MHLLNRPPRSVRPAQRKLKRLTALSCVATVIAGTFGMTAPAVANEPTNDTKLKNLSEEIGERGSFMGQSVQAKRQGISPQEAKPENLLEARALTPRAGDWKAPGINGLDVSGWQPNVDWQEQKQMGAEFAYVKATEGDTYVSDTFDEQYIGAYNAGLIRGAYHFALPQIGNARSQAHFFVNNGGGWSADGKTLPPLLDIEHNPYPALGNMCYDMSPYQLTRWLNNFSDTVQARTGRKPMIYTSYAWWTQCTNNSTALSDHALHAAAYPYPGYEDNFTVYMFGGWQNYTMWQYSSTGPFAGDSNQWHGSYKELQQFATNGFADVTTNTKYYDAIMWADRQNITNGWKDGTFRPYEDINRDAMAAFLYRLADKPRFNPPNRSPFKDYSLNRPFYKEITWLESTGITNGWKDGTYRPLEPINRDAMAAFLYRMAGEPRFNPPNKSPFKDYGTHRKFYKEVAWLESTGISTGWADGTYRPSEPINRDAMAVFLQRYDKKFDVNP